MENKETETANLKLSNIIANAEQGDMAAQFTLGLLYDTGLGVAEDKAKAFEWYAKAAEQGDASAQLNLGQMFDYGSGVAKDKVKAVEWYTKSAEQGNASAQFFLGLKYEYGVGVDECEGRAIILFSDSAKRGNEQAVEKLREKVQAHIKKAEQGDAIAQDLLGMLYNNGYGVAKDEVKAFEWYLKAAEKGVEDAQREVARMYSNGCGVAKDESKAGEWRQKACAYHERIDFSFSPANVSEEENLLFRPSTGIGRGCSIALLAIFVFLVTIFAFFK